MDNKIEHFVVLKPDGKIYWIENMPIDKYFDPPNPSNFHYRAALQSAIDNAVEVSNQEEVENKLWQSNGVYIEQGKIYSLQCSVVVYERCALVDMGPYATLKKQALVTFSQPEREETQEQIFDDLFCQYLDCIYNKEMSGYTANIEIQRRFTITRKTP